MQPDKTMISRHLHILLFSVLLLQSGCTAGLQAITAPQMDNRLVRAQPIRLLTPLATVYSQDRWEDEPSLPAGKGSTLSLRIHNELSRQLKAKGWPLAQTMAMDWQNIAAGKELTAKQTVTGNRQSQATLRIMRQLDQIGRQLRNNQRIKGIQVSDQRVAAADSKMLAKNGSLLFAVVIGCDGRLTDGPCREIQSPPLNTTIRGSGSFRTVPAGRALHLYWLDADNGQLLWYDTSRSFNADPNYAKDIAAIVAETLSEFPTPPEPIADHTPP